MPKPSSCAFEGAPEPEGWHPVSGQLYDLAVRMLARDSTEKGARKIRGAIESSFKAGLREKHKEPEPYTLDRQRLEAVVASVIADREYRHARNQDQVPEFAALGAAARQCLTEYDPSGAKVMANPKRTVRELPPWFMDQEFIKETKLACQGDLARNGNLTSAQWRLLKACGKADRAVVQCNKAVHDDYIARFGKLHASNLKKAYDQLKHLATDRLRDTIDWPDRPSGHMRLEEMWEFVERHYDVFTMTWTCHYADTGAPECKRQMTVDPQCMDFDHLMPHERYGPSTAENMRPACSHCNRSKGAKTEQEFRNCRKENLNA